MKKSVNLKIESCIDCPNCKTERDYTSDSFEYCEKWNCNFSGKSKVIRRYVDWHDHDKFIPDWCPLVKKKK
jgi:hypothetical protein